MSMRRLAVRGKLSSGSSLPLELWLYIHRLAVSHLYPLAELNADEDVIVKHDTALSDPLNSRKLQDFLEAACSLRLVCRLWGELAKELLNECIWVKDDGHPPSLLAALHQPSIRRLVRCVRLSPGHFLHNEAVLQLCGPRIKVIVQPEFSGGDKLYAAPWPEDQPSMPQLSPDCVHAVLARGLHFAQLSHLTIAPTYFEWELFPVLPALRVLSLVVDSSDTATVPFHAILDRCRSVEELRYGARDTPIAPYETQVAPRLLCVRLYLDARMSWRRRGWRAVSRLHATLLLRPTFGVLRRVVLDGSGWLADESPEWPEWALLRERDCRVEYPNHKGE
ncbi:hypothetical protein C8R45DRAFT_1166874 [Mycena sanguinolenta]|nr:hypothetical protein C8R45DRAFT_1166874 [Mycena sanguinolenta]